MTLLTGGKQSVPLCSMKNKKVHNQVKLSSTTRAREAVRTFCDRSGMSTTNAIETIAEFAVQRFDDVIQFRVNEFGGAKPKSVAGHTDDSVAAS